MTTPPMYRLFKAALTPGFALAIFLLAAAPTFAQPIGSGSGSVWGGVALRGGGGGVTGQTTVADFMICMICVLPPGASSLRSPRPQDVVDLIRYMDEVLGPQEPWRPQILR